MGAVLFLRPRILQKGSGGLVPVPLYFQPSGPALKVPRLSEVWADGVLGSRGRECKQQVSQQQVRECLGGQARERTL